ncbi:MAG: ribosome silencing factor [Candidatus Izemoplasmataceae bacterium]
MSKINIIINSLESLKLEDIIIYDMRTKSPFFDYFILSTASNSRQLQASLSHLKEDLTKAGYDIPSFEGTHSNSWVLVDAQDVIVNIFTKEDRLFYNIEKMWLDIPQVSPNDL